MDDADRAQSHSEEIERVQAEKMAARPVLTAADSADNCVECGLEIPSERQLASPGCTFCIDCAAELERKSSNFA